MFDNYEQLVDDFRELGYRTVSTVNPTPYDCSTFTVSATPEALEGVMTACIGQFIDDNARIAYTPKRILRSGPATIVFWEDGTKTIVKFCAGETEDSAYAAFTAALAIKIFGSNSKLKKLVRTLTEEQK